MITELGGFYSFRLIKYSLNDVSEAFYLWPLNTAPSYGEFSHPFYLWSLNAAPSYR
jgi:hypothetical protein